MDWKKIKEKKAQLSEAAKRIENQKKLLRSTEKKLKVKRYIQLGELFERAGIDIHDEEGDSILLGGLCELKKLIGDTKQASDLKMKGEAVLRATVQRFVIRFNGTPSNTAQTILEMLKFKWRPLQQEWHGTAKYESIKPLELYHGAELTGVK